MKTKILLVVLLSTQLVHADQFKVHYSIHGSGKDIIVNADSSDDAQYTVQDMCIRLTNCTLKLKKDTRLQIVDPIPRNSASCGDQPQR